MNKIYRIVFNQATQTWTAVCEYARAKGKGSSTTVGSTEQADTGSVSKLLRFTLVASGMILSAQAIAANGTEYQAGTDNVCYFDTTTNSVICGTATTQVTDQGKNAVSVGIGAEARNNNDVAIGNGAGVGLNDKGSNFFGTGAVSYVAGSTFNKGAAGGAATIGTNTNISIGQLAGNNATGVRNINMGKSAGTQHFGEDSVTIGTNANNFNNAKNVDGSALATGDTFRARRTVAIGNGAMSYGEQSIAIGNNASTKQVSYNNGKNYTTAENAIALGNNARAAGNYSIAQGANATAQGVNDIVIGTGARAEIDPTATGTRTNGIAIGNGAKIGPVAGGSTIAIGGNAKVLAGNNSTAVGSSSQTIGNNLNVALGNNSRTWGDRANAIGNSATSGGFDSVAIGAQSHVMMQYDSNANPSNNGVAVGAASLVGGAYSVAVGNAVAVFGQNSGAFSASSRTANADTIFSQGNTATNNTGGQASIIGGNNNFAIGNANVIGTTSHNNMVMGNRIAVGATNATMNGTITLYRLAIRDTATGQTTISATAYIKDGNNYYAYNKDAAGYKGAQLDLTGKSVTDAVTFTHIIPTFNNTKSVNRSVAIGQGASVADNDTIAMGTGAVAGDATKAANATANAIAIGNGAQALAKNSISVGTGNVVTGEGSGAFGDPTTISGTGSYSVGNNNTIATNDTFVVGSNVVTTADNSVFLGKDAAYVAQGTSSDGLGTVSNATVGGITYAGTSFAGQTPVGVVSVGAAGKERRIQNVAAGLISATSTDAINGSQLYAVASTLGNQVENIYFHTNTGANAGTGDAKTNLGKITDAAGAKNVGAVTAGMNAVAETSQSIAIGHGAKAGAADKTGSSNWANIIDPRTKQPFTSEAELLAYYETVKTNPANTVTRALIGKINNIAIGAGAVAEGGRNISIGENAGAGTADNWNIQNVNIGTDAGQNSKKDYSVAIGYRAGTLTEAQQLTQAAVLDGARHPSILIGKQAGEGSVAYGTVAMGSEAGKDISDVRSVHNIAIGRNAGQGVSSNDGRNATFGGFGSGANTMMGASAGRGLSGDGNVAIGNKTGEGTTGDNNIMMGHLAGSGSTTDRSIIMGNQTGWSTGTNDRNVLIGNFVNGGQKANVATAVGIGNNTIATGNSSVSIGNQSKATAVNSIAQGTQAVASGENAISIGAGTTLLGLPLQPNTASGVKSVAIGYANNATGVSAIAIGTQNSVSGANAGAIGDPSIVSGAGSYTLGNDNAVGSTSTNVGAFGNNNQIGATANYDANGKLIALNGLADTAAVDSSRVVGNKNYVNTSNTYVLGSGVGTKDDGTVLGTVENSVYLGNDSTVAEGAAVGTKNLDKEGVAGTTTTAGDTGTVDTATVAGVTYSGFAGKTAAGAVSVGSAGAERRVMNVAAGEISATSTDAINGSQLYLVTQGTLEQMPVIYTDTDGNKVIKSPDGNFYPAGTVLDATGKPVDTTIQPVANVIASMNDGDNKADTPQTLTNVKSNVPVKQLDTNPTGTDARTTSPILDLDSDAAKKAAPDSNAATVGDLRNMGWVIAATGNEYADTVKNANWVNFVGTGLATVTGETEGGVRTITVDVNAQQVVEAAQLPVVYTNADGDKLMKVGDNFYPTGSVVSPNGNVYPEGTVLSNTGMPTDPTVQPLTNTPSTDVIASMNDGSNSTTNPMTLTNIEGNLNGAKTGTTAPTTVGTAPTNVADISNNAATVGDVLNAGFNLQNNGTAKDFVKAYDTVNFVNGTGTTAVVETATDGKSSTVKYNVNVDGTTITTKTVTDPNTGETTSQITANTTPLTNTDGKVNTPANTDALATAGDIANAINNSGWKLAADGTTGTELINPSDTVTFKAGSKNLTVARDGANITYDLANDININSVQFNDGPKITNDGNNIKIGDKDGNATKITNVAKGDVNATSTDAVNGSQLYAAQAAATTKVEGDQGVSVTPTPNADGSTTYTVAAKTDNTTVKVDGNGNIAAVTSDITTDGNGVATATTPTSLATAGDVAEAINASGFNIIGAGNNAGDAFANELINPGDTVTLEAGKNLTVAQTNGKFVFATADDVNFNSVKVGGETTYADADGNPVTATTNPDGTVTYTNAAGDVIDPADVITNTLDPIEIGTVDGKNVISNLSGNLPNTYNTDAYNTTGVPVTTSQALPADLNVNNAATVGDILNSGWNLQGNGTAKDFVKPYDTVNFINGAGTTAVVETAKDGKSSTVTYNVNVDGATTTITYVDADGNPLTKGTDANGDTIYTNAAGDVVAPENVTSQVTANSQAITNNSQLPVVYTDENGTQVYPIIDDQGNVTYNTSPDGTGTTVDNGDVITSVNGPEGTTTPTTLANVNGNLTPTYNTGDMTIDPATGKPTTTAATAPTTSQTGPSAEDAAKMYNNAATVGDVLNAGWNLQGNSEAKDFVKPYDTVNFADGTGTTVDVTTSADGKTSTIKVNVNAQSTVESAQTPVVYTNKDGDKVYKQVDPTTGNVTYNTSPDGKGTTVAPADVIASMNDGSNSTNNPMTLGNVASNLPSTSSLETKDVNNTPVAPTTAAPITAQEAADIANTAGNNAATVSDVLNAGWNLQTNGEATDFVKPYDTVNFVNGSGTTVTSTTDGATTNIAYNVNVDGTTTEITYVNKDGKTVYAITDAQGNVTYNTARDGSGTAVDAADIAGSQISAITQATKVNGSEVSGPVNLINGDTTTVSSSADGIKVEVNTGSITANTDGSVAGPAAQANADLKAAQDALNALPATATAAERKAAEDAVAAAQAAVNTAGNKVATAQNVADAINNSGFKLTTSASDGTVSGTTEELINPSETITVDAGKNIAITQTGNKISIATKDEVEFTSVKADTITTGNTVVNNDGITIKAPVEGNADNTVSLTKDGLNNGGNRITNVAPGVDATDAVNVSQLQGLAQHINNRIDGVADDANAGVSSAMAMAALPQAYIPGKSMLTGGVASYNGESAVAVGFSKLSDNGRWVLKVSGSADTQGNAGGAVGAGFHF